MHRPRLLVVNEAGLHMGIKCIIVKRLNKAEEMYLDPRQKKKTVIKIVT